MKTLLIVLMAWLVVGWIVEQIILRYDFLGRITEDHIDGWGLTELFLHLFLLVLIWPSEMLRDVLRRLAP